VIFIQVCTIYVSSRGAGVSLIWSKVIDYDSVAKYEGSFNSNDRNSKYYVGESTHGVVMNGTDMRIAMVLFV
jgi:hypothetical protein